MKFQTCILTKFERRHGQMDGRMDGWTEEWRQDQSHMPLQLFQNSGHMNHIPKQQR